MIRGLAPLAMVAAAACTPVESMPAPDRGRCDAAPGQRFVGADATARIAERVRRATGSRTVRVVGPGQAVTMEYRADRVTVSVDSRGRVDGIRCG